jgi:pilus assembly protein CpaE
MILLVDSDPGFHTQAAEQLGRQNEVVDVYDLRNLERILAEGREGQSGVVLVGPNMVVEEALRVAETAQATAPGIGFVLVTNTLTSDLLRAALRAGVRDVLPTTFTPQQLVEAIGRTEATLRQVRDRGATTVEPEGDGTIHQVVTVFSSKGGCGKSFVASNLAVMLAQRTGEPVAVVDLDLEFGDLAIMLQVFPARTIHDAAQNLDRIDPQALRGYLTPHRSGAMLLAAPLEPGLAETISAESVRRIIEMLKQMFRYVVIDSPPSFTDHMLAALDQTEHCALITSMDVPAIKNLKLSMQTLELLRFGHGRTRLVLNRADSKVGLTVSEVEKTLAAKVDVAIPSSIKVPLSINRGAPLCLEDPKSPVVMALSRLVDIVTQGELPRQPAAAGRFHFGRR